MAVIIAICDTNRSYSKLLKSVIENELQHTGAQASVLLCDTPNMLLSYLKETNGNLDLQFCETSLDGINGISFVKEINSTYFPRPHLLTIFISSHFETVYKCFEAFPLYFLKKPIQKTQLISALHMAVDEYSERFNYYVPILSSNTVYRIPLRQLAFVESDNRLIIFHHIDGHTLTVYSKLDDFEYQLPKNHKFVRIHKSYLVNMDMIRYFNRTDVTLYNGDEVPVSAKRFKESREIYYRYIGISPPEN